MMRGGWGGGERGGGKGSNSVFCEHLLRCVRLVHISDFRGLCYKIKLFLCSKVKYCYFLLKVFNISMISLIYIHFNLMLLICLIICQQVSAKFFYVLRPILVL